MLVPSPSLKAKADDDAERWVQQRTGKTPVPSQRVRLFMPKTFPNGYTVPLSFDVDTPMTQADHVVTVQILAPRNPLPNVATFYFIPGRSLARVSTRIRLAEPQFVVALAAMNDGALLMTKAWVDVASDGCE